MTAKRLSGSVLLVGLALLLGCDESSDVEEGRRLVEGDVANGRRVARALQCGACHRIPGVAAARGRVGPSLEGFALRGYIAGRFPNRPPLLISWVTAAPSLDPSTAMPAFPMTEREGRDLAAFLYTLN